MKKKRWRQRHPKQRSIMRQKNYAQTAGPEKNYNWKTPWTIAEIKLIELARHTDRELHKLIGRSVQAIQMMRWKIKKGLY